VVQVAQAALVVPQAPEGALAALQELAVRAVTPGHQVRMTLRTTLV
jgi:hypothetical protein